MTDAERIAAGLTDKERTLLLDTGEDVAISGTGFLHGYRRLSVKGLVNRTKWRVIGRGRLTHFATYKTTDLGLEVRAVIERQTNPAP
jgi:hypothetical protein